MDARTEGVDKREQMGQTARGRRDNEKEDGAVVKPGELNKSFRELGALAIKSADAKAALKEAVKAVAKKSGLLSSVVSRMVRAQAGDSDSFNDEKRKVEQLGLVFEEIGYQGEITKETKQ